MKKSLILSLFVILIAHACKKGEDAPGISALSFEQITYSAFINSTWNHVAGGMASIEYGLKDANNVTTARITDSVSLKNIESYRKELGNGKYDIAIASKSQSSVADTFIRFTAQIESFDTQSKQAVSLTAVTTDGLVTIAKSFIKENTIPVFKSDDDTKTYNLGFIDGFYYVYIKDGATGSLTFTSKDTGQEVSKSLAVTSLNHYNLEVISTEGVFKVEFTPFTYLDHPVGSSTLLTLNLVTDPYSVARETYFVVTDEMGKVLNEVKYIKGTTTFKISSNEPFHKERFNFFEITIPQASDVAPSIVGYLQVKKGSTYVNTRSYSYSGYTTPLKINLKNASGFDELRISTDAGSIAFNTIEDTAGVRFSFSDKSKIWAQMLKNNQLTYHFFDITKGTHDYDLDLSLLTQSPLVKTITAPGDNFAVSVFAKSDKSTEANYYFGTTYSQYNQLDYYYPSETFQQYYSSMSYDIGSFNYQISTTGTSLPSSAENFDASFTLSGSSLADFKPTVSGVFDFYQANFLSQLPGAYISVHLYSPSAANYNAIRLPDFAKYFGKTSLDLGAFKLEYFGLHQREGFSENKFYYNTYGSFINGKSVWGR